MAIRALSLQFLIPTAVIPGLALLQSTGLSASQATAGCCLVGEGSPDSLTLAHAATCLLFILLPRSCLLSVTWLMLTDRKWNYSGAESPGRSVAEYLDY